MGRTPRCLATEPMCQIMFYNHLPTSDTIHKWTLAPEVGRFHISALTDVESGQWGGHHVAWPRNRCVKSCFIINCQLLTPFTSGPWLQKWAGSTSVPSPMWNSDTGAGHQVSGTWNRCVKSCVIINCQLLTPFTSGPWLQKWAGSTSVPSPMWNHDTKADTKCTALEPMCQVMFYDQLPARMAKTNACHTLSKYYFF